MSRAYRNVRPKANLVYSVADVMALYHICRNTLSNWVSSGLRPSDNRVPQLFRGAELIRFHSERRMRSQSQLRKREFKCTGCKAAVYPAVETLYLFTGKTGTWTASARCPDCNAMMIKFLDETECDSLQYCINTNTSLARADEEAGAEPAGIGKKGCKVVEDWYSANDRIIYQWLPYARRYDAKTIDAHLASIRYFEQFVMGKSFKRVTTHDVDAFRTALIAKGQKSESDGRLSKSTIRHRMSHLTGFFGRLRQQDECKRLPGGIQDYFALPRGATALAFSPDPKPFPTIDEAIGAVKVMPARNLLQRRNRAIVALAFMCGFRAAALISLRLRHLDLERKIVAHNGAEIRAKNGKSYPGKCLPRTEPLREIVASWVAEMCSKGLRPDDALFPDVRLLEKPWKLSVPDRPTILPMSSEAAVSKAFEEFSTFTGRAYTPHSARHCLFALGRQICRTPEEEQAWALAMGHSSPTISKTHYAKMTHERADEIFEGFDTAEVNTTDEKDLMLAYHEHKLAPGSSEFDRARKLVAIRMLADDN